MDSMTFGITMLVAGMGGTLLTLFVMSVIMSALGRIFPVKTEKKGEKGDSVLKTEQSRGVEHA